jgi:NAD(P)-dependent dehydrogenase (short-subunit alcohol dehydrogenase family)
MTRRLEGKVAVVAGGATGLGAATCRRLAAEGAAVVIGDINIDPATDVASAIEAEGGRAVAVTMDLADEASVREMIEVAVATYGGVDLLDNNAADTSMRAGIGDTDVVAIDLALWDRIFAINLRGFVLTCRYAIPAMLERGGGAIVNIASGSGLTGEPDHVAYGCSKAGVIQLARHVAVRWGKEGIRCNAIAPGLIYTEKLAALGPAYAGFAELIRERVLTPELGRPEDVAATVAYLLSDDARYVTGQVLSVDGGMFVRGGTGRSDDPSSSEGISGERVRPS